MNLLLEGFTSLTSALNNSFGLVGSLLGQPAAAAAARPQFTTSLPQQVHQPSYFHFPAFSYHSGNNNSNNDSDLFEL